MPAATPAQCSPGPQGSSAPHTPHGIHLPALAPARPAATLLPPTPHPLAVLRDGGKLPCDMFVVASGCKYNLEPPFLKELGLGERGAAGV